MKKLLILLLALLAIAAIGYFCVYQTRAPAIQEDIQTRAQSALSGNGLSSINAQVDGRDITLTGVASSKEMKQQAEKLAKVDGYHIVNNQINTPSDGGDVADLEVPSPRNHSFGLLASDDGKKIIIDGILDANSHQTLKAEAIKAYGEGNVTDRVLELDIPVAEGMPKVAISMLTALQEKNLDEAVIIGNKIQIRGEAPNADEVSKAEKYLKGLTPDGYELSLDLVTTKLGSNQNIVPLTTDQKPQEVLVVDQKLPEKSKKIAIAKLQPQAKPKAKPEPKVKKKKPVSVADLKRCQRTFNRVLRKNKVRFNSSSSTVKRSSYRTLNRLVSVAKKCSGMKITIHGHTDSTGRNKLNKRLSKKRARKVATYLANKGIPARQLLVVGHGSSRPIATNKNEKGRARNRRIEFTVEGLK